MNSFLSLSLSEDRAVSQQERKKEERRFEFVLFIHNIVYFGNDTLERVIDGYNGTVNES